MFSRTQSLLRPMGVVVGVSKKFGIVECVVEGNKRRMRFDNDASPLTGRKVHFDAVHQGLGTGFIGQDQVLARDVVPDTEGNGTITYYNVAGGWGVVKDSQEMPHLVRHTRMTREAWGGNLLKVYTGDRVQFDLIEGTTAAKAVNLRPCDA